MDYQQYGQYAPQSTYQPYLGMPTPTHSGSANSDDYGNSPPVRAQSFHYLQYQSPLTVRQDAASSFDQFSTFDYNQFHTGLPPPKSLTPQQKPAIPTTGYEAPQEMNDDSVRRGSNSDDDENMTPAQSRRKAQNRAA